MNAQHPAMTPAPSTLVTQCQICGSDDLRSVLFVGFLPPVNTMRPIGVRPNEEEAYPAELLHCPHCSLVQLGLMVDPVTLFPPDYPYTSGTTKILHDNFAALAAEAQEVLGLKGREFVIDIGSNDGTLLSKFQAKGYRVLGIEPTGAGQLARDRGIPTEEAFFTRAVAERVRAGHGRADLVTAANCFAHIQNVHEIVDGIIELMAPGGVFVSESHYLVSLLDRLQYDTIYHEHLRYYSLTSLAHLLGMHGLEIIHATPIPTHGGSIRVYAARAGERPVTASVEAALRVERSRGPWLDQLARFKAAVTRSKLELYRLLAAVKEKGGRIAAISAPSRASTLVNYLGLDDGIIDYVAEIAGSRKIGKCLPGTLIPVVEESRLFSGDCDHAILFSWHIADELMEKLRARGYKGRFIVPLPEPRIV